MVRLADFGRRRTKLVPLAALVLFSALLTPMASAHSLVPGVVATVSVPRAPVGVAYDSRTREIWVAHANNDISIISDSTNTVVSTLKVGFGPYGVAYDFREHEMFITNIFDYTVSVAWDGTIG